MSRLGEQPFAGDLAAEIVEKRAPVPVDRLGVGLRAGVFPELDVGVRLVRHDFRQAAAVGERWQGRTCGEVDADSGDVAARAYGSQYGLGGFEVIRRALQSEAGGQFSPAGQRPRHDPMSVRVDMIGALTARSNLDQHATRRLRTKIETDEIGF
ncbi:MAG TPA: hypothetical protein VN715_03050 [Roseiarcus sp.]|nr:hypothetical protein [Roseiarcus sp.]